jgi:hypothetical protein
MSKDAQPNQEQDEPDYKALWKQMCERCDELDAKLAKQEQGEPVAYINIEKRRLEWAHDYMSWDTPTVVNLPRIPLYTTLQPAPQGEPVIAGALFDFMGWLTSRKERLVLSSADEASPAVDAIRDFAKMRGLSLDDARVQDWNTTPQQRIWVGLTDEDDIDWEDGGNLKDLVKAIEAKLKEKNS